MPKFAKWPKTLGMTSKKNIAFPEGNNYELSAEDITSDYRFLLRLVNTFSMGTDKYYPVCYKVNDAKTFKNLVHYFMLANHHVYYRLARLTGAFKIIAIDF